MELTRLAERYEILRPLGRGSFAQTLLARDLAQNRLVAIKMLHPRAAQDWKTFELFERETAVLRDLRHQGIPALDAADVLHLFLDLLAVLDYLHSRVPPILHRDIKPANVIVRPDGSAALVDFGAVRNVFRWSVADVFLVALFSLLTAGVLPAVVWSTYRSRKRRLKKFMKEGHPAVARLLDMKDENIGFEIKLTRVRYAFEVNGKLYRDSDQVLPSISQRWDPGTQLQILYLPDEGCDSVIISTS